MKNIINKLTEVIESFKKKITGEEDSQLRINVIELIHVVDEQYED